MIKINDQTYSIGQVCELLSIESFNLRYIEKTVGLEIKRNTAGERIYCQKDLETVKFIFELKDQGLNYKAIKKVLEHQDEVASDIEIPEVKEALILKEQESEKFLNIIKDTIDESIETKVNSRLEGIISSIEILVQQNKELKKALDHEQERHFIELDKKLTKWREDQQDKQEKFKKEQEETSKPWFKKIFK